MEQFISSTLAFLAAHPTWAFAVIGVTAFGESFVFLGLLFPGTTILIAAGALAANGTIDPVAAVVAGVVGAVLGDSISFWLGQRFATIIPNFWLFRRHPEILARGTSFFERYGGTSVFIGRFFGPLRAVIPLTAGMSAMPAVRFYIANVVSAVIWAPALVLSGMLLGHSLRGENDIEGRIFVASLGVGIVVVAVLWARRFFLGPAVR